jgi:hypothetical protein
MTDPNASTSQPSFSASFASKTMLIHTEMLRHAEIRVSADVISATTGD